jgi:YHS domain-containing protein
MNFLARIVKFLFWLLVLSWGLRLLRHIVGALLRNDSAGSRPPSDASQGFPAPSSARRLVRDPVCGMHLDETRSIPFRDGGELVHFCSAACRDAYAVNVRKLAANG